ncbi:MAG: D-glycero-beta-D-manno-heptose 1,7-bisphosphate 7-phosphatase [Methylophilaceae bacterium]|jgi:D-glycero-D-manno-heptose 1,7-bisphosphate phosphatase|nr:D-glycero-beta-D-manno-heptose 1,7-bisphosphate 7-phosphatase [Methylophilaceae bacterium]
MKLVILDRDGVINDDHNSFIKSPDEWTPINGSSEAIALLNEHGFTVAVATNQSGIARGLYDIATLDAIHDKMHKAIESAGGKIEAVYYCPHINEDNCDCRKPKSKMVTDIGRQFNVDLKNVAGIGDSLRDLQSFSNAGCQPMLVLTGNGEKTLSGGNLPENTLIFNDLAEAVQHIVSE